MMGIIPLKTIREAQDDQKRRMRWLLEEREARRARDRGDPPEPLAMRMLEEAREAREAQEAREKRAESAILSMLYHSVSDKSDVGLDWKKPSGGREFYLLCLASHQAGKKAQADYLHSKEVAKQASKEAANQALLQKAHAEGGYG